MKHGLTAGTIVVPNQQSQVTTTPQTDLPLGPGASPTQIGLRPIG
jgi:hypothetical protein